MSIVFGGNDSFGFTNDSINVAFGLKADTNMLLLSVTHMILKKAVLKELFRSKGRFSCRAVTDIEPKLERLKY